MRELILGRRSKKYKELKTGKQVKQEKWISLSICFMFIPSGNLQGWKAGQMSKTAIAWVATWG